MPLPGIPADRVQPDLVAATADFATVVTAAAEAGGARIEPSHLLVALARVPGGVTAGLFDSEGIPPEVLVRALRRGAPAGEPVLDLRADSVSDRTRAVLDRLASTADAEILSERALLREVLDHLEPVARELLETYGGVDLARWRAAAMAVPTDPPALFGADGALVETAVSPGARHVLCGAARIAGPGAEVDTLAVLEAMGGHRGGLLSEAAVFLGFRLDDVRAQVARKRPGRSTAGPSDAAGPADGSEPESPPRAGDLSGALRTALLRAAGHAAARRGPAVTQGDLLEGLLDGVAGAVPQALRAGGADLAGLRHFAETLYREPAPSDPVGWMPVSLSVDEALARLGERLIGQRAVLESLRPDVATINRAARRGFRMGDRPLGTYMFCGPSGTGKTMTARLLAEVVFGSSDAVLVFDMGQFNSRESINNFVGAPPGYVGYGEGALTNGLDAKPRCVLLFDEVEKAHPLVLDALLRLLDEGKVNDPGGPVRDARDTVVVFTSNLAQELVADTGDAAADGRLRQILVANRLRPEFLNRIGRILLFAPFDTDGLEAIAVAGLRDKAADVARGLSVDLRWDDDVPRRIVERAGRERREEAARGVNRCVDEVIADVLREIDDSPVEAGRTRRLRVRMGAERLTVAPDG